MDPNKLCKQKDYFRIYFGTPQVLSYIGYDFLISHLQWFRFLVCPDTGCQHLTAEQVENELQELSSSFKEFILLFQ